MLNPEVLKCHEDLESHWRHKSGFSISNRVEGDA